MGSGVSISSVMSRRPARVPLRQPSEPFQMHLYLNMVSMIAFTKPFTKAMLLFTKPWRTTNRDFTKEASFLY